MMSVTVLVGFAGGGFLLGCLVGIIAERDGYVIRARARGARS